ncbi:MAG: DUF4091 domain-containing protein [Candidatus Borkfalkiaceae bacterium]|nr:DUF4091 domain-containing protein [Christensenellaceae bacterium]
MYQTRDFEILPICALEKVRGERPQLYEDENTVLSGERAAFQVAYRSIGKTLVDVSYTVDGVQGDGLAVYIVKSVPCTYPSAENSDDYVLDDKPCLMPDILAKPSPAGIVARSGVWQAFYITVDNLPAGKYNIRFTIYNAAKQTLGSVDYSLTVLPAELPENDLVCTFWMHYDSIADQYGLPLFSKEYNEILKEYMKSAVKHGLTMLLTPLFTPPIDTEIGKERMTVQLVGVKKIGNEYLFDFEKLGKFIALAEECGVKYFEAAHLFTQWGGGFAPKIVVNDNGEDKRLFGWDTPALGDDYKAFLAAFLPKLRRWLISCGKYEKFRFHLSDEPSLKILEHYKACGAFVRQYLPDAKFVDAMSHYEFYGQKLVDYPFVALDETESFIENGAKDYFVYYCMAQRNKFVSNRFLSMPLERTRILGVQMYLNGVRGFLQWGYNYYYSFLTREKTDPFFTTDCMGKFQSGDSFVVYPDKNGVLESVRNEAFLQGIQDYLALEVLEKLIGRQAVCEMLESYGLQRNFNDYPKNAAWLVSLRERINQKIVDNIKN